MSAVQHNATAPVILQPQMSFSPINWDNCHNEWAQRICFTILLSPLPLAWLITTHRQSSLAQLQLHSPHSVCLLLICLTHFCWMLTLALSFEIMSLLSHSIHLASVLFLVSSLCFSDYHDILCNAVVANSTFSQHLVVTCSNIMFWHNRNFFCFLFHLMAVWLVLCDFHCMK